MKIVSRVLFLLFLLICVLMAISNAQPVQVGLWPLPHALVMPLYLLVVGLLLAGVLAGVALGWWAGRHHRKRAKSATADAARGEREIARLKTELSAAHAAHLAATGAPEPQRRDSKALERQGAIVQPELLPPTSRAPAA